MILFPVEKESFFSRARDLVAKEIKARPPLSEGFNPIAIAILSAHLEMAVGAGRIAPDAAIEILADRLVKIAEAGGTS